MPSRSSSVSRLSTSENATKIFEGRVYVANSTTFQWKVEVITNETEFGNTSTHPCTIGAHQVLPLSCIYEFQEDTIGLISRINKRPIIVKATKKNGDVNGSTSYELPVKNKSGLIITEECLIYSQKRYTPRIFKPFTFGDQGCWKSKFVKNMTYDPHKNISKGGTCPTCKAQNTQRSSTQEPCTNEPLLSMNLPICPEMQKSEDPIDCYDGIDGSGSGIQEKSLTPANKDGSLDMGRKTNNQIIIQPGGQLIQHTFITDTSTNIVNHITIENLNKIIQPLQPLTNDQNSFLDTHFKNQNASTLGSFHQSMLNTLPKIETILKSVCLLWWKEFDVKGVPEFYSGTGFLAEVQGAGIAFLSAGHNFQSLLKPRAPNNPGVFSLKNFVVHFGNVDGKWLHPNGTLISGTYPLKKGEPMNLGKLLEPFNVCGSVSYDGHQILFKNGKIVHYQRRIGDVQQKEDYCILLLNDNDVPSKLNDHGLGYLQCGHGGYLESNESELVAILGHPACPDPSEKRALRLSFGTERHPDEISNCILTSKSSMTTGSGNNPSNNHSDLHSLSKDVINNYIYYDNDTLPGNSGSPVIGRGDEKSGQAYCVKGIHVAGFDLPNTNRAQNLKKIEEWIDVGRKYQ